MWPRSNHPGHIMHAPHPVNNNLSPHRTTALPQQATMAGSASDYGDRPFRSIVGGPRRGDPFRIPSYRCGTENWPRRCSSMYICDEHIAAGPVTVAGRHAEVRGRAAIIRAILCMPPIQSTTTCHLIALPSPSRPRWRALHLIMGIGRSGV